MNTFLCFRFAAIIRAAVSLTPSFPSVDLLSLPVFLIAAATSELWPQEYTGSIIFPNRCAMPGVNRCCGVNFQN